MNKKLLSLFLFLNILLYHSQQITITNNSEMPFEIQFLNRTLNLKKNEKQTISGESKLKNIRFNGSLLNVYLEPSEKLSITNADNDLIFKGDKDSLHSYLRFLNHIMYGKIKDYQQVVEKNNTKQYINTSELTLSDIFKKIETFGNIDQSTKSYKRLKENIIYNWLTTSTMGLFSGTEAFQKEVIEHYYKKYIEKDIGTFQCDDTFKYPVIEFLAKNKKQFGLNLPTYPIVMASHDDEMLQYFPTTCQQEYFELKYKFLKSKKDTRQEIFKKVLKEKFHQKVN
jgi:hypothetical protein